ncbi:unnamed protein product [Rhizoctonia solani]|uniref:Jacalin-type lectin domain-containing protein n=1 Tax=Rhizoctonia solani TaxID=456999 RepID=A0A8H3A3Z5_9AGAM|nr:unnamed protein product [Rhizoctonia solani]
MSFDPNTPTDNVVFPPECTNNQGESLNDSILQKAGWLHGLRMDDICGPRVSARQVASYVDGATVFIEYTNELSTETIVTSTKRETNYVHRGWSMGAIATVSPWTLSRIAARNQPNAEGTWYTKLTKAKRLKVEVKLEDLAGVPEFEAAIENALKQPTTFEKFQAIYRTLDRWGDVVPLEIEIGSSLAMTDTKIDHLQFPETGERNFNSTARLSAIKIADITVVVCVQQYIRDIDAYRYYHKTYDDNQHSLKTISSVMIRFSDFIELLTATYSDSTISSKHGGSGHVGTGHKFMLATDEHIAEMFIWRHDEWIRGFQFITSMGQCSPQYGTHDGLPTIARSRGGVLAGFLIHTRNHSQHGQMYSDVQGVWRHDLIPRVLKEDDVYSDYLGDSNGRAFNDRVLVGNSNSVRATSVEIRSGDCIDSIQFTYVDVIDGREYKFMTPRHGGPGGSPHQFVLEDGEHIVTVSGWHGEQRITQL